MSPAATVAPHHRRRWLYLAGGIVLLVLIAVAAIALVNPSAIATRVKDRMLPQVSERLGRQVQAGDVHVTLFPHVGATVSNVAVAGGPNEPPLLNASEAAVGVKLWPLIRSRGREVDVTSIELRNVDVNLVRRPDGHWSYEDLMKGSPQNASAPAVPSKAPSHGDVQIAQMKLTNGNIHVIDESAGHGSDQTVALAHLNITANNVGPGRPATLSFAGALASESQNLNGSLSVDPLPTSAAELHSGSWPKVNGRIALSSLALRQLDGFLPAQLGEYATGGNVATTITLSTENNGHYAIAGQANVDALRMRGSPASGGFQLSATVDPDHPKSTVLQISNIRLNGPGIDLAGTATLAAPDHVRFALSGQRLDLDTLLGALPPAPPKPQQERPLVPATMRHNVQAADVSGTLTMSEISSGKLRASELKASATLSNGVLTLTKGSAGLYGGQAILDGTNVNLLAAHPTWDLRAKLNSVNLDQAMTQVTGSKLLTGQASSTLALRGAGNDWNQLRDNLTGNGQVGIADGTLATADLTSQVEQPLMKALSQFGAGGLAPKPPTAATQLKDLTAQFTVQNGWLQLRQPLTVTMPFGSVTLGGRIGLDERLQLSGHAALSETFLAGVAGGHFQPKGGLDVPIQIGGTLKAPTVEGADWGKAVQSALVSQVIPGQAKDLPKSLEKNAQDGLRGLLHGF